MSISFSFLMVISDSDIRFYDTPMNGDRIKYYISQRTAKTYHEPLYVPYITIHRFIYVLSRCAFVNGYLIRITRSQSYLKIHRLINCSNLWILQENLHGGLLSSGL